MLLTNTSDQFSETLKSLSDDLKTTPGPTASSGTSTSGCRQNEVQFTTGQGQVQREIDNHKIREESQCCRCYAGVLISKSDTTCFAGHDKISYRTRWFWQNGNWKLLSSVQIDIPWNKQQSNCRKIIQENQTYVYKYEENQPHAKNPP